MSGPRFRPTRRDVAIVALTSFCILCAGGGCSPGFSPLTHAVNVDGAGLVGREVHLIVHCYTYGGAALGDVPRNARLYRVRYDLPARGEDQPALRGVDLLPPVDPPREGALYLLGPDPNRIVRLMEKASARPPGRRAYSRASIEVLGPAAGGRMLWYRPGRLDQDPERLLLRHWDYGRGDEQARPLGVDPLKLFRLTEDGYVLDREALANGDRVKGT